MSTAGGPVDSTIRDRFALRDLVERYATAADQVDADLFASLWTPDAVLSVYYPDQRPPSEMSGDAITGLITAISESWHSTLHIIANHRVQIDGNHATGEAYCVAHHLAAANTDVAGHLVATDHIMTIRYSDTYSKNRDVWRFKRRNVHLLWTQSEIVDAPVAQRARPVSPGVA